MESKESKESNVLTMEKYKSIIKEGIEKKKEFMECLSEYDDFGVVSGMINFKFLNYHQFCTSYGYTPEEK